MPITPRRHERGPPIRRHGLRARYTANSTYEISRHIIVTVKRVALLRCGLARVRIVEAICSFIAGRPIVRFPPGPVRSPAFTSAPFRLSRSPPRPNNHRFLLL